jgi:two-component system LytT family response regulator
MQKLRSIIVDDESSGRSSLHKLILLNCPTVEVVSLASSANEAYPAIVEHKPNLVFLDIEMPTENGFQLLSRFTKIDFHVIFVTAYDKYAIQAIKLNALDYLLKPVRMEELISAVTKATNNINANNNELLANFLRNYKTKTNKLAIPIREGFSYIDVKEIVRCEADANYTVILLTSGAKVISSKTIGEYEETLRDLDFIRVHKSHMINASHVKSYLKGEGGTITMSDGFEVPVSRRKRDEFLTKINSNH